MIRQRQTNSVQIFVLFITYIALLQVLYAFQTVLVSLPMAALISTSYFLILQRILSGHSEKFRILIHSSGTNPDSTTTEIENEIQNHLLTQAELVLQAPLPHFRRVRQNIEQFPFSTNKFH